MSVHLLYSVALHTLLIHILNATACTGSCVLSYFFLFFFLPLALLQEDKNDLPYIMPDPHSDTNYLPMTKEMAEVLALHIFISVSPVLSAPFSVWVNRLWGGL